MARPFQGSETRTAGRASHHKELDSDGVVAPPVCAHRVVPHRWVVRDGYNPSGSAVDAGLEAAHGCYGRRGRRMTVLYPFRRPSMCRPVPRQCMRNALLDLTTIVPATACHQSNDVETYSRYRRLAVFVVSSGGYFREHTMLLKHSDRTSGRIKNCGRYSL